MQLDVTASVGTFRGLRQYLPQGEFMSGIDDFRFKSHQLLIELDASTSKMMMMVSAKEVAGADWDAAALRHRDAFQAWNTFLNSYQRMTQASVSTAL